MKPHWNRVKDTLNALGYLVKSSDLDGIDLYFTNSSDEAHSKDRRKLIHTFNRVTPRGICHMSLALGKILDGYPERTKDQDWGFFSRKKKKKWGLNVYVFTDGVWDKRHDDELCGVHEPIAILLKKLAKENMVDHHVGIQFVQFGNDRMGTNRLDRLDRGLKKFGISKYASKYDRNGTRS